MLRITRRDLGVGPKCVFRLHSRGLEPIEVTKYCMSHVHGVPLQVAEPSLGPGEEEQ